MGLGLGLREGGRTVPHYTKLPWLQPYRGAPPAACCRIGSSVSPETKGRRRMPGLCPSSLRRKERRSGRHGCESLRLSRQPNRAPSSIRSWCCFGVFLSLFVDHSQRGCGGAGEEGGAHRREGWLLPQFLVAYGQGSDRHAALAQVRVLLLARCLIIFSFFFTISPLAKLFRRNFLCCVKCAQVSRLIWLSNEERRNHGSYLRFAKSYCEIEGVDIAGASKRLSICNLTIMIDPTEVLIYAQFYKSAFLKKKKKRALRTLLQLIRANNNLFSRWKKKHKICLVLVFVSMHASMVR